MDEHDFYAAVRAAQQYVEAQGYVWTPMAYRAEVLTARSPRTVDVLVRVGKIPCAPRSETEWFHLLVHPIGRFGKHYRVQLVERRAGTLEWQVAGE